MKKQTKKERIEEERLERLEWKEIYEGLIQNYTDEELESVLNDEQGIYLTEGLWLFPDGTLDEW